MPLRAKLLLPLLLIGLLMGGFLNYGWIPNFLAIDEKTHLKAVDQHLDSVAEAMIPLLLGNQLDIMHENLNALKQKNPQWVDIRLYNADSKQLYPLATTPSLPAAPQRPEIRTLGKNLMYLNMNLGTLVVRVDLTPSLADARQASHSLALILYGMLALLTTAIMLLVEFTVRRPLHHLAEASKRIADKDFDTSLPRPGSDEVGALVGNFTAMRDSLRDYQTDLLHEIAERKEAEAALTRLNATLEQRVEEEVAKNRDKDHLLIQQSRLAAMGEMVHNIAHQWRQPLNSLGLIVSNLRDDFRFGGMTAESVDRDVDAMRRLISRMSTTIDDFREFFRPDRTEAEFDPAAAAREAAFIMEATLAGNHIELVMDLAEGLSVLGFHGQYAQAVLNLLANSKEAILERKVGNGQIRLRLCAENGHAVLSVEDNGGGIPADILPRLFDPYFTTKEQGSGIGLYMTKTIIERNMHGRVSASNIEGGARLTLSIPLHKPG